MLKLIFAASPAADLGHFRPCDCAVHHMLNLLRKEHKQVGERAQHAATSSHSSKAAKFSAKHARPGAEPSPGVFLQLTADRHAKYASELNFFRAFASFFCNEYFPIFGILCKVGLL